MDRPAGLVRRQGRHVRHQLSRRHPARPGRDEPAPPDDHGPDRRRVELRRQRHAARRRVRAAIHELDLPDRGTQQPGGAGQPGPAAGPWSRTAGGSASTSTACRSGRERLRCGSSPSTRRGWSRRCGAGPKSPFWHIKGMSVVDHVGDYADVPVLHITGWYDSWTRQVTMNYEALSQGQEIAAAAGDRPLGARRAELERRRRGRVHPRGRRSTCWHSGCGGTTAGCGARRTASTTTRRSCSTSWGPATTAARPAGRLQHGGFWRAEREWPLARSPADAALTCTPTARSRAGLPARREPARRTPSTPSIRCRRSAATSRRTRA